MTIFASINPADLDGDPAPWSHDGGRSAYYNPVTGNLTGVSYDPRPTYVVTAAHPFNPVLNDFRRLDGNAGWWAEDCAAALTGEPDTGTGSFADILDSLGAWNADDEPISGLVLTPFQLDCLAHASNVLARLARAEAAATR